MVDHMVDHMTKTWFNCSTDFGRDLQFSIVSLCTNTVSFEKELVPLNGRHFTT